MLSTMCPMIPCPQDDGDSRRLGGLGRRGGLQQDGPGQQEGASRALGFRHAGGVQ